MKNLVFLFLLVFLFTGNTFASFPVKEIEKTEKIVSNSQSDKQLLEKKTDIKEAKIVEKSEVAKIVKKLKKASPNDITNTNEDGIDTIILLLLLVFLGALAGHRWYAGKPVLANILFILTGGGLLIWWIIDLFRILGGNFME